MNLIGKGMLALLRRPDQAARPAGQDTGSGLTTAVEELLRYDSPVRDATFRCAGEPIPLHGRTIGAGDIVSLLIGAANRAGSASPIPTTSTWGGHPTTTSPSGTDRTSASARPSPVSRAPSRSPCCWTDSAPCSWTNRCPERKDMMSTRSTQPAVLTERREGVLVITLNRPHVRNAVNQALAEAVDHAFTLLDTDPGLDVGVLTGAGGHFCSGMDLKAFPDEGVPRVADRGLAGLTRARRTKPLIAAVEGAAVAADLNSSSPATSSPPPTPRSPPSPKSPAASSPPKAEPSAFPPGFLTTSPWRCS